MLSDYEAITKHNEEMLGKDTASRKSQVMMYSDFTHFVYEILQNADDYGATKIEFLLSPDLLTIEHNGSPFRPENVQAISYFENSTSREDVVKTGHFGLGFKSVFAFTATPFIFSGEESFEIYNLYRLRSAVRPENLAAERTRIQLPFNHCTVRPNFIETHISAEDAFERISTRLRKLDLEALLFTRNLKSIEWQIANERDHYIREDEEVVEYAPSLQRKKITIRNRTESQSHYVFNRPIVWSDSATGDTKQYRPVEIAFRLGPQGIERQPKKHLVVLFETKIETKIGFLINGPYRTTPNRESIKEEDTFNQHLMQNTATLVTESLPRLKELGLVSVALLETLPLRVDDFPADSLLRPVFDAVRETLLTTPLLPTYREEVDEQSSASTPFTSGRDAKLAGSHELRKLLSREQLTDLHGRSTPISWISGDITADRTPGLWKYLREVLGIEEIDAKAFVLHLDTTFLTQQTDEWLVSLYGFLHEQQGWLKNLEKRRKSKEKWPQVPFFEKLIIRLENDQQVLPFADAYGRIPAAFFPAVKTSGLPTVKLQIAEEKEAQEFLKVLGFTVPDSVDIVLERILPNYVSSTTTIPDSYLRDVRAIIEALQTDSEAKKNRLRGHLQQSYWMLAENVESRQRSLRKPKEVYVGSQELIMYFAGNASAWFLDKELEEFSCLLEDLGVSTQVRITHQPPDSSGNVSLPLAIRNGYARGLKGFDPGTEIDGFVHALTNKTIEKARFIWNDVLLPHRYLLKGTVETVTGNTYDSSKKVEKLSKAGQTAIAASWLPTAHGEFCKPSELCLDDLPNGFERDEELAKALGMKLPPTEDAIRQLAEAVGVDIEELDYLKNNRDEFQEFKKWNESHHQREYTSPVFPVRPIVNPKHREEKVIEQLVNAPHKAYEEKGRSVRTTTASIDPSRWLLESYTNEGGQMVCQLCQKEMPFRKRNGEYYFEAVEALPREHLPKEHERQFLALCPLCAAKYKEFVKKDEEASESFRQALMHANELQVRIQLDKSACVRFVETHLHDLKLIVKEQSVSGEHPNS